MRGISVTVNHIPTFRHKVNSLLIAAPYAEYLELKVCIRGINDDSYDSLFMDGST